MPFVGWIISSFTFFLDLKKITLCSLKAIFNYYQKVKNIVVALCKNWIVETIHPSIHLLLLICNLKSSESSSPWPCRTPSTLGFSQAFSPDCSPPGKFFFYLSAVSAYAPANHTQKASLFSLTASFPFGVHLRVLRLPPQQAPMTFWPHTLDHRFHIGCLEHGPFRFSVPNIPWNARKVLLEVMVEVTMDWFLHKMFPVDPHSSFGLLGLVCGFPCNLNQLNSRWWSVDHTPPSSPQCHMATDLITQQWSWSSTFDLR